MPVKAFECTEACSANGKNMLWLSFLQRTNGCLIDGDQFAVHVMLPGHLCADRFKCSCAHMKGHIFAFNRLQLKVAKQFFAKMQTRRWRSHRTVAAGINRLIALTIFNLGFTVNIWRQRNLPCHLQYFAERKFLRFPAEKDKPFIIAARNEFSI